MLRPGVLHSIYMHNWLFIYSFFRHFILVKALTEENGVKYTEEEQLPTFHLQGILYFIEHNDENKTGSSFVEMKDKESYCNIF